LTTTAAGGAWAPAVHFRIHDGIVVIIGVVQTIEIKQQIEECVRRVPGVVRIENTIEIGSAQGSGGDSDQALLLRVRETVLPQIQVSGIDFQCHDGVVTVLGAVPQEEVKQRLVTLIRQVPGAVNVTDQVTVNAEVKGQAESTRFESGRSQSGQVQSGQFQSGRTQQGQVQPGQTQSGQFQQGQVQTGQGQSNQAVNAAIGTSRTNLPPTGRTNALPQTGSTNSLPPGLEKRDQIPQGLQNREQLPPGLSKRTNDSTQPNP
jgi:hypothetical protein